MTATDWKALDDFAAGIDGNRLPATDALAGTSFGVSEKLRLDFRTEDEVAWRAADGSGGTDWYEAVEVRPEVDTSGSGAARVPHVRRSVTRAAVRE